jgi:hypothetical protein
VDADQVVKIFFGGPERDHSGETLSDLARVGTKVVKAYDLTLMLLNFLSMSLTVR